MWPQRMFSGTPEINFSSNTTQRPGAVCCVRLSVYRFCCFRRVMKSSASMASGVKLLLFHQLARAAATVRPLEMSCSSWALSMGSMGLPTALST